MGVASKGQILLERDDRGAVSLRFGTSRLTGPPDRPLQLGPSPGAASIHAEPCGHSSIRLRLDPFGAFPLFIAGAPEVVGDSLPEVAAHADATGLVDPVTVIGRVAFESDVGRETILEGVRRVLPSEAVEIDFASGRVGIRSVEPETPRPDPLGYLIETVGAAFRDGADAELTGGYDSRLVLALGCAAGARPRTAITIGDPGDFDVECSSMIAARLGIRHRVIPFPGMDRVDWDAVATFWFRTGCSVDPLEYAWVPMTFGNGFPADRTQLSGVGGEIASGFYAFPADESLRRLVGWKRLIRWRMAKGRGRLASLGSEGERLLEAAIVRVMDGMDATTSWREFGLRMYVEERCRSWAGAVLAASATLYRPIAPLLTSEYRSLCGSVARKDRGRGWQHRLIATLAPDLLEFPFRARWATFIKIRKRWSRRPSRAPRPDPLVHGDERIRHAFELGRLQLHWSPQVAADHPGIAVGIGLLEQERVRILREIERDRTIPKRAYERPA